MIGPKKAPSGRWHPRCENESRSVQGVVIALVECDARWYYRFTGSSYDVARWQGCVNVHPLVSGKYSHGCFHGCSQCQSIHMYRYRRDKSMHVAGDKVVAPQWGEAHFCTQAPLHLTS